MATHSTYGFQPAFLDARTQVIYPCRYEDGQLAPFHILDGLPDEVVVKRPFAQFITGDKPRLVCGFLIDGRFHTREEAVELHRS